MVLSFGEMVLSVYTRLVLLPVARSPFARTPLKIGDHFSSKGARLLERAVPRLKDKAQVRPDGAETELNGASRMTLVRPDEERGSMSEAHREAAGEVITGAGKR